MKKILILSPYQFEYCPYHQWFKGHECQLFLLASTKAIDHKLTTDVSDILQCYQEYCFFDDFDNNNQVIVKATEVIERVGITHIVCLNEMGLERAAHLREIYNVPGQGFVAAQAYRNKRIMKQQLEGVVELAEWRYGSSFIEVFRFTREIGFPCVYKHVAGAGSVGTIVFKSPEDVLAFAKEYQEGSEFLIEVFVPGEMYTVDGYFHQGKIHYMTASRLINTCLSYQQSKPLGSQTCHPDAPQLAGFRENLEKVISALPSTESMPFHAEFWLQSDGRIVLCEIASRMGGAGIREVYQEAMCLDLMEIHALCQAELPVQFNDNARPAVGVWGYLLMPPKRGKLLSVPQSCPIRGAVSYLLQTEQGVVCNDANSSVSCVQKFIINSDSESAFIDDFAELERWSNDTLCWSEVH